MANWFTTMLQGVGESGLNYLQQNAPQPQQQQQRGGKKGSIGKSCTPCAIAAKREQMQKRWRPGGA